MPKSLSIARVGLLCTAMFVAPTIVAADDHLTLLTGQATQQLFETSQIERLRYTREGAIKLDRGVLVEDDGPAAGYSYKPNEEVLRDGVRLRKQLVVDDVRAARCVLMLGGSLGTEKTPVTVFINGREAKLTPAPGVAERWAAFEIDPALLRVGLNDIEISGTGKLWIARADEFATGSATRTVHPNRSAKSTDGGATWDDVHLGKNGDVDGEYCVRLFLDQYVQRGSLVTRVVDAANSTSAPIAPAIESLGAIQVVVDGDGVTFRARTGSTFAVSDDTWSDWQPLGAKGDTIDQPRGRYLQIAVVFATDDASQSPRLRGIGFSSADTQLATKSSLPRIVEVHNPPLVRTSIPFAYEPFDQPALRQLREQYKLDEVTAGAKSEFELITKLAAWTAMRWDRLHLKDAYPPFNALEILKSHTDGTPIGGFCQQHNLVFLQACESFGLVGRCVSIGPNGYEKRLNHRGGHEVVEIFSNEYAKWVYVDGDLAWYAVDAKSRVPLSLWELHHRQVRLLAGSKYPPIEVVPVVAGKQTWPGLECFPPFVELRLLPRSNFLQQQTPLPLNQGMRGWFWTGHAVWDDDLMPAALLYGDRIHKRGNFEWSVNQVELYLEATADADRLLVQADTVTPGFDTLLAKFDDETERPVVAPFEWNLHSGKNRLEVRPRNIAGRVGVASSIVVELP